MTSSKIVKEKVEAMIQAIGDDPAIAHATFRAATRLEQGLRCVAKTRGKHAIVVDESSRIGGTDQGMNPVELLLSAMGTCQEIMYSVYASVLEIPIDELKINCKGNLDLRGLFGIDDEVSPGLVDVEFETHITSSVSEERISELIELAERRCPIMDSLARSIRSRGTIHLNGRTLRPAERNLPSQPVGQPLTGVR